MARSHVVPLLFLALCAGGALANAASICPTLFGSSGTLLVFADPGTFSGSAESQYIHDNIKGGKYVTNFDYVCGKAYTGTLLGQKVATITTGIGPTTAGLCTFAVLKACGGYIKEAIYFGTSGWSAAVGGIVTPQGPTTPTASCSAPGLSVSKGKTVRVGDVCITPHAQNWACKLASWTQQCNGFPNLCMRPEETFGPSAAFLYGQCFFTAAPASTAKLVKELLDTAASAGWKPPQPSDSVYAQNTDYWNATSAGTGISYPIYDKTDKPLVFGPDVCMETDAQFFYSGVPWDITARDYVAEGINLAYNLTGAAAKTALDVIAVSAMEAVGFNQAFERYHAQPTVMRQIPYTSVRGNSDFLHHPVKLDSAENGVWSYERIMPDNFAAGYGYAIASYSSLALQMFSARCKAQKRPAATCAYTLNYVGP